MRCDIKQDALDTVDSDLGRDPYVYMYTKSYFQKMTQIRCTSTSLARWQLILASSIAIVHVIASVKLDVV